MPHGNFFLFAIFSGKNFVASFWRIYFLLIPFYDFFIKEFLPLAESAIENSFKEKRPYLVNSKSYANNLFQNIVSNNDGNITNKEIEINDIILRQLLFLFNLELWTQIFIESDNLANPNLELNKFF